MHAPVIPVPGTPEHDEAMAAKFEAGNTNAVIPPPVEPDADRPAWLPEKFKTPEDMAAAYTALSAKLGSTDAPATPDTTDDATPKDADSLDAARKTVAEAGLDFDALAATYAEAGVLGEADYAALEAAGIPKDIVDGFIAGQVAVADNLRNAAFGIAGGEEAYTSMVTWAQANMSPAEISAFNQTVGGTNADQVKFAVSGLKARYEQVNGTDPSLLGGGLSGAVDDTFANWHQVKTAMKDPRYSKDAQYRQGVEAKLGRSNPT